MKKVLTPIAAVVAAGLLTACGTQSVKPESTAVTPESVVVHYADIAEAAYGDSYTTALTLESKINAFLAAPTEANLQAAKDAWIAARVPYQQTEVYRFGNAFVDDWEGKVNAWPLDEGLIDYVSATSYGSESDINPLYTANVVANSSLVIGGEQVDASNITPELISDYLQEADGVEANVASGYHAIEFLLWGQDLHGTNPGAGERPATDFDLDNCTNGNCDRRRQYLSAATELLVSDLKFMANAWQQGGDARAALLDQSTAEGLSTILTGMGSLAYGELGGERTKLGLMLHDPEEEHDCFSDNTHNSHYYDAKGIENVYLGEYQRVDGSWVKGPSLSALIVAQNPALDVEMKADLLATDAAGKAMVEAAKQGQTFDVLIAMNNTAGNALVQTFVDSLVDQTRTTEEIIRALDLQGIALEGSDSLDNPGAVFE
ncbi:Iron-regulated protein A precursor [Marinomonas aquimarina]|uniref:Iron-regulated protein A n=1 Tax=Marinomonas aquimarina TaxID=295068 RepID=A0A1A8TKY8_9GAMM|nr:imelysin family protein [Marinomonas aquimarina]SBS33411.1 Iron-regulated protein A precursor [Marinomonas aquimarina]